MAYIGVPPHTLVAGAGSLGQSARPTVDKSSVMIPVPSDQPWLGVLRPTPYVYTLIPEQKSVGYAG